MRRIGRYTLLERLASGPSSDIYLAWRDDELMCAVKLLKPRVAKDAIYREHLLRESHAASRFHHPASTTVYGAEQIEGEHLVIAMELVEGQPLAHVIQRAALDRRPLSRDMVLWIAAETASVLGQAHMRHWCDDADEPMVHGALTPYSVMLTYEGRVKLLGTGLGRSRFYLPPSPARLGYRAPEVFDTNAMSPACDIYALGVIIYEALSNKRLFRRPTLEETRSAIIEGRIERLKRSVESINDILDELVWMMMLKDPRERAQSAAQVEQALRSQFRASDEVMVGRFAELMQQAWHEEYDSQRQLIGIATRKISPSRPASDPFRPLLTGSDGSVPATDSAPAGGSDLLADVPTPVVMRPTPRSDRKLVPQSGPRSPLRPPALPPKERRSSSGSGAAPIAGQPSRAPALGRIGRFDLIAELGRIGASSTYEARAGDTRQPVFLKAIDEKKVDDARLRADEWVHLFDREVQIARDVQGSGLPVVVEAGVQGSLHFVAYDRVDGIPLNVMITRGKALPVAAIKKAIASAARTLHFVHERGFVYCNLLAQNVMLMRDGNARLNELSMMAPQSGPMHPLLMTNVFALAPEYLYGREYEPASDQFALGALLYELLTGTRPFRGLDDKMILQAIREKDPIAPTTIDSQIDSRLSDAALRAMAKSPEARFPSCKAMAEAL